MRIILDTIHRAMATTSEAPYPLDELPAGSSARISAIAGPRSLRHRLLGLGLHPGETVTVLQRRGTGLVVAVGASRVALDLGIARLLSVEAQG